MPTGERIKEIRIQKRMTQKQLGEKCGMADSAIRKYESGRANPKIETLEKIADALEVSLWDLSPDTAYRQFNAIFDKYLGRHLDISLNENPDKMTIYEFDKMLEYTKDFYLDISSKELLKYYAKLNTLGKEKALERVKELTELSRYQAGLPE